MTNTAVDEGRADMTPMQMYFNDWQQQFQILNVEHMHNYDEIYTEKNDGQIILQRNLVNLKFEFYTLVDNIIQKEEKVAESSLINEDNQYLQEFKLAHQ